MDGRTIASIIALLAAAGCGLPKDPEDTLSRLHGGTLRAGVTPDAPWVTKEGDTARGLEAELIEEFARAVGARVEWNWGGLEENLHRLSAHELDVVIGGLTDRSPWKKTLGFTRAYVKTPRGTGHVMAVAPGENATLVALERHLHGARGRVAAAGVGEPRP